jgi:hypothetical protein
VGGLVSGRLQRGGALWAPRGSEGNRREAEGALLSGWCLWSTFPLPAQAIDEPYEQEDGESHNEEINDIVEKGPVINGRGACSLGLGQRGV